MKKLIILISISFVFIASFIPCQAQETKTMQVGVKGGLNISNLYTSDGSSSDMLAGFNVGVFTKMPVTNSIAFQPEINLSTKGASVTYNNLFVDGTAKFNLTYIEVPFLCVLNVTRLVNLQFGPYVAYLIDGKVTNVANVTLFNFEQNMNVNDYNRLDAGIVLGAGLDVGSVTMGARYNYGLTKVGKTSSFLGTNSTFPDATNGVINFYVSVGFN